MCERRPDAIRHGGHLMPGNNRQHLELFDDAGKLVARFEARHMK